MSCDVAAVLDVSGAGPLLLLARPDGTRELMELPPGEDVEIRLADRPVSIRVEGLMRRSGAPADPASPPRAAVVDVEFEPDDPSSLDSAAGTRRTVLVPYASARAPDAAVQVSGPEGRFAALYLTPRYRPLPAVVEVLDVEYLPQPGSLIPRDFVTEVRVDSGDRTRRGRIRLNRPLRVGPYRLRHERWMGDPRAPQALIFGVSTRPGAAAAWAGMAMVILGSAWGFYLKPLLRGRRAGR
jgi:hypothetical protein